MGKDKIILQAKQPPQAEDIKKVFVDSINKSFLNVHFEHYGRRFYGYIHISNIKDESIDDLFELLKKVMFYPQEL